MYYQESGRNKELAREQLINNGSVGKRHREDCCHLDLPSLQKRWGVEELSRGQGTDRKFAVDLMSPELLLCFSAWGGALGANLGMVTR